MTTRIGSLALASLASAALVATSCSGNNGGSNCGCPSITPSTTLSCPPGQTGSSCQVLSVFGLNFGNKRQTVDLRQTPAAAGVAPIGKVLLLSSGLGTEFTEDQPGGVELVQVLTAAGFEVFDRRWHVSWLEVSKGPRTSVLRWSDDVFRHVRHLADPSAPLFVIGQGEGADEAAYSLVQHFQAYFEGAVLASGPLLSRIDYACATTLPNAWAGQCPGVVTASGSSCASPTCATPASALCGTLSGLSQKKDQSVLSSQAILDQSGTDIALLFGADDCTTVAATQGSLFASQLLSPSTTRFVPGVGFDLIATQAGRDAIVAELMSQALPPPAVPAEASVRERITVLDDDGAMLVIDRQQ